jgi:hypothetical protein
MTLGIRGLRDYDFSGGLSLGAVWRVVWRAVTGSYRLNEEDDWLCGLLCRAGFGPLLTESSRGLSLGD